MFTVTMEFSKKTWFAWANWMVTSGAINKSDVGIKWADSKERDALREMQNILANFSHLSRKTLWLKATSENVSTEFAYIFLTWKCATTQHNKDVAHYHCLWCIWRWHWFRHWLESQRIWDGGRNIARAPAWSHRWSWYLPLPHTRLRRLGRCCTLRSQDHNLKIKCRYTVTKRRAIMKHRALYYTSWTK